MLTRAERQTDAKGRRDCAMVRLLNDLALRCGEVAGLDLADLDLERQALWVLGKERAEKELLELPPQTCSALRLWLSARAAQPGVLSSQD
jgi:integrase/recombinase XerC